MMMEDFSYDPMTEEQAQQERFSLLPEGDYEASIERFEGKMSSSGNRMVVFDLNVYDKNGNIHSLKDFIAFTPKMTWKLRHHCVSAGLETEFNNRTWRPNMSVGKIVRVKVIVQQGSEIPADKLKGKPAGSRYPDRNVIDDYLVQNNINSARVAQSSGASEFNDDIPF